ncbi:MAG TPA: MBL fold metallo-hydrolase [Terriglobales bacterium]|jgi:L-ascorbate metabolism protein UlaG (beta-lactamase superfamily)|nr:MBL fold metallo-hydrolase [Terriglobales bacterium]
MLNITIRKKAKQFSRLVRHSALTPLQGEVRKPVLAENGDLGLTFIGHSGFFIQMGGKNLVIDPNFARWLVVLKRQRRPGVKIKDLPPIDYVLVTHAHMDHLHKPSLRALARMTRRKGGRAPKIIVPHHVKDLVLLLGFEEIIELTWWKEFRDGDFSVTHTPSRHWGARMIRDYHRGYGGYVLRDAQHSLYHAGDTAYFDGFREIGARLKPEIALLPIGAYHPPSFRNVHTSPEDAVRAFLDLGAQALVPMHYGTFRLSHEPMDEPLRLLAEESAAHGVSDKVVVLEEGVTRFF